MMQIPNGAWSNFLILGLKFTPWMLGIMFIIATVFSWLGDMGGKGEREEKRRPLVAPDEDCFSVS